VENDDVSVILEEHGMNQGNLEAAAELARLVAEQTGMCCEELGRLMWRTYSILEGQHEFSGN
jgi:hypothetical protein